MGGIRWPWVVAKAAVLFWESAPCGFPITHHPHPQAIVAAPEVAKEYSQQVVETEHLLKALLEQPNGLARYG